MSSDTDIASKEGEKPESHSETPPVLGISAEKPGKVDIPGTLPILPMRETVIFPGLIVPLTIQREASIKLLDDSLPRTKIIGVVAQRDREKEKPDAADLFDVGVAVMVLKLLRQPEGVVIIVQALQRFAIERVVMTEPFLAADVRLLESSAAPTSNQWQAEVKNLRENAIRMTEISPNVADPMRGVLMNIEDAGQLTDFIAANLDASFAQKQALLEELDVEKRLRAVQTYLSSQLEIAELQQKLQKDVASQFTDAQRRAYLQGQLRAIQRELGEDPTGSDDQVQLLRTRLEKAAPPAAVMAEAERELKRLEVIPPASPEYSVIVSYVEMLADLPWQKTTEDNLDLAEAKRILDRDHFGLEKIKRRLIEYLAVRKLNPTGRGSILCFLGPPGVGKTSLGQSIADALGRKFSRISLGGMRDEAEIRGHRRTYIGSMPGRIIQELRRLGTRNPVLMLDEVDKLGADFRGDPASALLEVLDPRQNNAFVDRYLDAPFDLSSVIFIATANYIEGVPPPLRDRMEIIELPGYTDSEKLRIAIDYIVPRQLAEHGLKPEQCEWEESALRKIIEEYTREAGVRNLERQVAAVCRRAASRIAQGEAQEVKITPALVEDALGAPRFLHETRLKVEAPGIVTGLAYTPMGGEILHIEATRYAGSGRIILTGQIGDVMKESAQAALSLVRSRAVELKIDPEVFAKTDIHIHVPAGAVPKDGPSAGVAMFTALASLFTDKSVRANVGMTGEITLRGLVLPIGGLKEKSLAAMRAGLDTIIIPKLNEKDLADIPEEAKQKLKFIPVETGDEALKIALVP